VFGSGAGNQSGGSDCTMDFGGAGNEKPHLGFEMGFSRIFDFRAHHKGG